MRNHLRRLVLGMLTAAALTVCAFALEDTVKVGLYYGSGALFSANLQNFQGSGYELGWYDELSREFCSFGFLEEEKISMTADGNIYISGGAYYQDAPAYAETFVGGYHVELYSTFSSYEEALAVAAQFPSGFVAYIDNQFVVRAGHFLTMGEAEVAAATYATYVWHDMTGEPHEFSGYAVAPSGTGVTVTETTTDRILFEFDCSGAKALGIQPWNGPDRAVTWFKGYKWYGGFEYRRSTGGSINVINVVDIDDYVKGVLPYEMDTSWPLEALKAQAVCARTYALRQSRHYASYKFDVCNTTDCQVYFGTNRAGSITDQAVEETAGIVATYNGELAQTYYYSSNGGASESVENVWGSREDLPYLLGKEDPYESTISIAGYAYSVHYTFDQLTQILNSKDYNVGTVKDVYISKTTAVGNVGEITFVGSGGRTLRLTGEKCKTVFYTTLFGDTKSVRSMRFTIQGGSGGTKYYVNGSADGLTDVSGVYVISGSGAAEQYSGEDAAYVLTASGLSPLRQEEGGAQASSDGITITGTGSGHNVGMSQYGAKAMALLGYGYEDILDFYYTGTTLESVRYSF